MTSTDFSKRKPHSLVLDRLQDSDIGPLWPRHNWEELEYIEGYTEEQIQQAIEELIDADIVVERTDPHIGEERIGLKELVDAAEAPYLALKDDVYVKAKALGLWPKWRPGEGWRLVNGGGLTVTVGPMEHLQRYLDELGENAKHR